MNLRPKWFRAPVQPLLLLMACSMLAGCMLQDLRRQIDQMDSACLISGTIAGDRGMEGPYIVAVLGEPPEGTETPSRPVDHFVTERGGQWIFALAPGKYRLVGFRALDGSLDYEPGDPVSMYSGGAFLDCGPATHLDGIDLVVSDDDGAPQGFALDLSRERPQIVVDPQNPAISLGQVTAFGETTTLDHARFSEANARDSLWRPLDFFLEGHGGLYFLQPFDPDRVPVLFIHGINGSPRVFTDMIESLDTDRFQPWVYYYPSGIALDALSDHLTQIMFELELRYDLETVQVVAHSMGGLVARAWLMKRAKRRSPAAVPAFISLSTPWGGHSLAQLGIDSSPAVVPVWHDLAPNSEFLLGLFRGPESETVVLPGETTMHMLFSYRRMDTIARTATDGVIALASLLLPEAQAQAATLYGIDSSHIGILTDPEAIERVNSLLAEETAAASQSSD